MTAATGITMPPQAISRAHIVRSFGQAAAHYDEFAALQRAVADRLLTSIAMPAPATVFDLGCGTGYCLAKLRTRFPGAELVALDLALPMLRASADRVPDGTRRSIVHPAPAA